MKHRCRSYFPTKGSENEHDIELTPKEARDLSGLAWRLMTSLANCPMSFCPPSAPYDRRDFDAACLLFEKLESAANPKSPRSLANRPCDEATAKHRQRGIFCHRRKRHKMPPTPSAGKAERQWVLTVASLHRPFTANAMDAGVIELRSIICKVDPIDGFKELHGRRGRERREHRVGLIPPDGCRPSRAGITMPLLRSVFIA
jgi:hypothetical protein